MGDWRIDVRLTKVEGFQDPIELDEETKALVITLAMDIVDTYWNWYTQEELRRSIYRLDEILSSQVFPQIGGPKRAVRSDDRESDEFKEIRRGAGE